MEQRQLRVGDTLDDYCPRERRLTTHAIVAIVGDEVKQTRCAGCDTEHAYKHGKVPRPRKKPETSAALFSQVASGAPKRVAHVAPGGAEHHPPEHAPSEPEVNKPPVLTTGESGGEAAREDEPAEPTTRNEEGPLHRRLIRASLPRPEGQPPPSRPIPEFTIRQPGGRPGGRFRPRHQRGGGQQFFGNRSNGNNMGGGGPQRGGGQRPGGGRPYQGHDPSQDRRHQGSGRRRGPK